MKKIIAVVIFLILSIVLAAEEAAELVAEGAHHVEEIPFDKIGWQVANLGILLIIIFFAIKASIKETFLNRKKEFLDQSEKTKSSLKNAELALADVKEKLKQLELGEKKSLENAIAESNILHANLVKESEFQASKINQEAQLFLGNELAKAKREIEETVLGVAILTTTNKITEKSSQITKDSEAGFLKQISQVKL